MADQLTSQTRPDGPITVVEVVGLFGKFSYRIEPFVGSKRRGRPSAPLFAASEDRLTLIYGKNGTGKTTLLRLLYHALSAAHNRRHRNALLRAPFSRLTVELAAGAKVEYLKNDEVPSEHILCRVERGDERTEWLYSRGSPPSEIVTSRDLITLYEQEVQSSELRFLSALSSLGINPVFLADTRVLESDLTEREAQRTRERIITSRGALQVDQLVEEQRDQDLAEALERVRRYLTQLIYSGAQRGSQRVDTIYTNVVKALVQHAFVRGRPRTATIPNLIQRITHVGEQADQFARYGLMTRTPTGSLVRTLRDAQMKHGPLLEQVLTPYLDGVEQRMTELSDGLRAIASYVDTVNSFFEGKTLNFRPPAGVEVTDNGTGDRLEPSDLSSGEKQILLLFSDLVALQETTRLFIIDEPELSLNPDWQRMLIPALLASTAGSPMQIVAATHSIEMMARYRSRIKALEDSEIDL